MYSVIKNSRFKTIKNKTKQISNFPPPPLYIFITVISAQIHAYLLNEFHVPPTKYETEYSSESTTSIMLEIC